MEGPNKVDGFCGNLEEGVPGGTSITFIPFKKLYLKIGKEF